MMLQNLLRKHLLFRMIFSGLIAFSLFMVADLTLILIGPNIAAQFLKFGPNALKDSGIVFSSLFSVLAFLFFGHQLTEKASDKSAKFADELKEVYAALLEIELALEKADSTNKEVIARVKYFVRSLNTMAHKTNGSYYDTKHWNSEVKHGLIESNNQLLTSLHAKCITELDQAFAEVNSKIGSL